MAILPQALFALMGSHFMFLSFLTTWHNLEI